MGAFRNIAVLGFLAGAYASNPDLVSFERHLMHEMARVDSSSKSSPSSPNLTSLQAKFSAMLAAKLLQRKNYYLFSVVDLPGESIAYVGLFGQWLRVPKVLRMGGGSGQGPVEGHDDRKGQ